MAASTPLPRSQQKKQLAAADPVESAALAKLQYVAETGPGIIRKRAGAGFRYLDADGKPIRDKKELARIAALVIPPAWTSVWICPNPNGHIQAVGRDPKGRKQYRYHARYRQIRDRVKFHRLTAFCSVLPQIRRRIEVDLAKPGLPREKVLATVVRLIETTFIRIGNVEYAKNNKSYGLTTLRDKHVEISAATVRFRFRGKSGQEHEVELNDRRLARIIQQCHDLPGYELFQYIDEAGQQCRVRTWSGTVLMARALDEIGPFESEAEGKRKIVANRGRC